MTDTDRFPTLVVTAVSVILLALILSVSLTTVAAMRETTMQMTACSESGGSYVPNDGTAMCLQSGQDFSEAVQR